MSDSQMPDDYNLPDFSNMSPYQIEQYMQAHFGGESSDPNAPSHISGQMPRFTSDTETFEDENGDWVVSKKVRYNENDLKGEWFCLDHILQTEGLLEKIMEVTQNNSQFFSSLENIKRNEDGSIQIEYFMEPSFIQLDSRFFHNLEGELSEDARINLLTKMFECVQTLHDNGLVHKDLKPDNFIIVPLEPGAEITAEFLKNPTNYSLKLIDFSTADFAAPNSKIVVGVGSANFAPPELVNNKVVEVKQMTDPIVIDTYAMAVIYAVLRYHSEDSKLLDLVVTEVEKGLFKELIMSLDDIPDGFKNLFVVATSDQPQIRFKSLKGLADALGLFKK